MRYNKEVLTNVGRRWSKKLGNRVRKLAPKHLKDAKVIHTSLVSAKAGKQEVEISLYVDPVSSEHSEYGDVFGRELGAGIYGARKSTYVIRPRKKPVLAFRWEKADRNILQKHINKRISSAIKENEGKLSSGKGGLKSIAQIRREGKFYGFGNSLPGKKEWGDMLLWNYVDHPGYKAANAGKGFIKPAYDQIVKEMDKQVIDDDMSKQMRKIIGNAITSALTSSSWANVTVEVS